MIASRLLVIGSNSDLIKPLCDKQAELNEINILKITRTEWDLSHPVLSEEILAKILDFQPNHVLYAAGLNNLLDPKYAETSHTLEELYSHLNVNCISFICLILSLAQKLPYSLDSVHAISSLYGIYGRQRRLPYSVSKHALEGAIKCLAIELSNTLVLGYRPGFFATKLTSKNLTPVSQSNLSTKIPLARLGQPSELSDIILSNIKNPPMYMSGSFITIDGGITAGGIFNI